MKLKLDENLGATSAHSLHRAGHDVVTVPGQRMCSAPDADLIEACRSEGRCLVTLDLDFANPFRFKPSEYRGIAVLRLPARPSNSDLAPVVATLRDALARDSIDGRLWIVQRGRVRFYQEEGAEE